MPSIINPLNNDDDNMVTLQVFPDGKGPEVTKAEWHDEDGKSLSSALVGSDYKL